MNGLYHLWCSRAEAERAPEECGGGGSPAWLPANRIDAIAEPLTRLLSAPFERDCLSARPVIRRIAHEAADGLLNATPTVVAPERDAIRRQGAEPRDGTHLLTKWPRLGWCAASSSSP